MLESFAPDAFAQRDKISKQGNPIRRALRDAPGDLQPVRVGVTPSNTFGPQPAGPPAKAGRRAESESQAADE
jgi:hypothetical protein